MRINKVELSIKIDDNDLLKEENPVYLGVQLDTYLDLKKTNLKKKAMKRLNLMKRLPSTNWGSDKNTLLEDFI